MSESEGRIERGGAGEDGVGEAGRRAGGGSGSRGGPTPKAPFRNPGWAGNTGEYLLDEADVRGDEYVGVRPLEGAHPSTAASYPYMKVERDPDATLFEGPYRSRFEKILERYPYRRAALLPVLNLAEEVRGHVSPATMDRVGELLGLPEAYVRGVATFYTMYNKAPVGRHLIQVCTNISCSLCGADEVLRAFLEHTGTEPGEISEDGEFTVVEVECLAACGFATCVQINSRYYESVAPEDVPGILARLREESKGVPGRDPVGRRGEETIRPGDEPAARDEPEPDGGEER